MFDCRAGRRVALGAVALVTGVLVGSVGLAGPALADVVDVPKFEDSGSGAMPFEGPAERTRIYEPYTPDLRDIQTKLGNRVPGMTEREHELAGGLRGSAKGGEKSGVDKNDIPSSESFVNKRAGKISKPKAAVIMVQRKVDGVDTYVPVEIPSMADLAKRFGSSLFYSTMTTTRGNTYTTGFSLLNYSNVFPGVGGAELAQALFDLTGGLIEKCEWGGGLNNIRCTYAKPKLGAPAPSKPFVADFAVPVLGERSIPLCAGVIVDGGYGVTTRISPADVDCETAPGVDVVKLEVDRVYADPSQGWPSTSPSGEIEYAATQTAQGQYIAMTVYAVTADGTSSMPFTVYVRNRYTPVGTAPKLEAIRGVEATWSGNQFVSDADVEHYQAESQDRLSFEVLSDGEFGHAFFDASGTLHYQSKPTVKGTQTDRIVVRAVDRFGLSTDKITLPITVTDVVPGCANGGATTDPATAQKITFTCWLNPPAGYTQLVPISYKISKLPERGTLSAFDPARGTVVFTPDPDAKGPFTFEVTANNNGALRTFQQTVNVQPKD